MAFQENFVSAGRENKIKQIQDALASSLDGHPEIKLVMGSAGTGKTTLIHQFYRDIQETNDKLLVAYGQCSTQFSRGDPYLPFKEILALLTGDVEGIPAKRALTSENARRLKDMASHSAEALVELGPDLVGTFVPGAGLLLRASTYFAKKVGWLKSLERLVEKPLPRGDFEPEQFFEQFNRVLTRVSEHAPLVLILDDLQWADLGTLDMFFYLTRRLQNFEELPLLLVGTYRPGEVRIGRDGKRHPLEKIVNEIQRSWPTAGIDLTPTIGGKAGRCFIDAFLEKEPNKLDEAFRDALFHHTEGHPLFTVELLRLLQDRGILQRDDQGFWNVSGPISLAELPGKVEAIVKEKIDRLEQESRDILTCGSIEGELFTVRIVSRVENIDEIHLARKLNEELGKRHNLVEPAGEIVLARQRLHLYRFFHTLIYRYLYDNLSGMERELLHGSVGAALEDLYADNKEEVAAQLARHFGRAYEDEKAIGYSIVAGKQAEKAYGIKDAIRHYERAREVISRSSIDQKAQEYQVAHSLARIYSLQGKTDSHRAEIDGMLKIAQILSDRAKLASCHVYQACLFRQIGEYSEAISAGERALGLANEIGDEGIRADAQAAIGETYVFLAEHDKALGCFYAALDQYRKCDNATGEAHAIRQIALVHLRRNSYNEALEYAQDALALFKGSRDRTGEATTLRYIGDIFFDLGDYEQALMYYEQALGIRREIGHRAREGGALGDIGDVYLFLGDYERSLDLHQQSLAIDIEVDYKYGQTWCHHDIGLIHFNLGDLNAARGELEKSLALAEKIQAQDMIVLSKNDLSLVLRTLGGEENLEQAARLAHEASIAGEQSSLIFGQIVGESYQAMAQLGLGNLEDAVRHSHQAVSLLEEHGASEVVEEEIFFNHSQVLKSVELFYLKRSHDEMMRKANRINNPEMRSSFLNRVGINREIARAWKR